MQLEQILRGVAGPIARARVSGDIVFVAHKPCGIALSALQKVGIDVPSGSTTVVASTCEAAAASWGHDVVTRRWLSIPPVDDQIKMFFIAGEGTALLTLRFCDGRVMVEKEPDLHVVP